MAEGVGCRQPTFSWRSVRGGLSSQLLPRLLQHLFFEVHHGGDVRELLRVLVGGNVFEQPSDYGADAGCDDETSQHLIEEQRHNSGCPFTRSSMRRLRWRLARFSDTDNGCEAP